MSDIDFQNGFIAGMATRGITRSGLQYEPTVWNDDGDFSGFYIDFKSPQAAFSTGMLIESLVVHDSEQIPITGFTYVSPGVYRVTADISGKVSGITVINKATSYLSFTNGKQVPPFSVFFYVSGITAYWRLKYLYDSTSWVDPFLDVTHEEAVATSYWEQFGVDTVTDTADWADPFTGISATETVTIEYV